jgi:hypothetical protein
MLIHSFLFFSFLGSTAQLRPWPPPQNPAQQFSFLQGRVVSPIPEDQASVFISPRGRVTTHFSRLLRHAWVTVGLFLYPGHHTGNILIHGFLKIRQDNIFRTKWRHTFPKYILFLISSCILFFFVSHYLKNQNVVDGTWIINYNSILNLCLSSVWKNRCHNDSTTVSCRQNF